MQWAQMGSLSYRGFALQRPRSGLVRVDGAKCIQPRIDFFDSGEAGLDQSHGREVAGTDALGQDDRRRQQNVGRFRSRTAHGLVLALQVHAISQRFFIREANRVLDNQIERPRHVVTGVVERRVRRDDQIGRSP